jgi:hypothetical protein
MNELITTLHEMHQRWGMYFDGHRSRSLEIVQAFVVGFEFAQRPLARQAEPSKERRDLAGFTEWVATHYRVLADSRDGFGMIREHVGGDERLGFEEFFRLLPQFTQDRERLGWEGIISQFTQVQDELWDACQKLPENQ